MGEFVSGPDELFKRTSKRRAVVFADRFDPLRLEMIRRLELARSEGALVVAAVVPTPDASVPDEERARVVAALASVDYALVHEGELDFDAAPTHDEPGKLVSWRPDREVYDQGDRFRKNFSTTKARDDELKKLWLLKAADVPVPEVLSCPENSIITARLPAVPLDELIAERWASMPRAERNRLIDRVAAVCRKIRDAGFDWPDLVSYHLFVGEERVYVIDPPRLRRGRLDLSALHFSTEEPTVSRADRLRFWRAYGERGKPRLRDIGHRGRFRPYRWVVERTEIRTCPRFKKFVNAIGAPYESADEVANHPDLEVWRTMDDRVNARLGNLFVKIVDAEQAELEWNGHRWLIQAGFRCAQPAVGGILRDGRGLFSSVRLEGQQPMDQVWDTLDTRTVVRAVADVTRRLHACGLVHRDLYLNHFYIHPGGRHPALVDLGRMQRTTARRMRIKDLAALYHSARGLCSRTELWRGFKRYGGSKSDARAILKKARRMARHVPKKIKDGSHTREPP